MPAWKPASTGSLAGGGSPNGGSVDFKSSGASSVPSAGVYHPTASGGGSGQAGGVNPDATPGVVSINPLDPAGSLKAGGESTGNFIDGLMKGIFGVEAKDGTHSGGVPVLSNAAGLIADTPGVNVAVGTVGDVLGGTGDALKNAGDIVGGTLERIPDPLAGIMGGHFDLDKKFNDPAVQAWLDETDPGQTLTNRERLANEGKPGEKDHNFDKGILGTGWLGNEDHMKNTVLREFAKAQNAKNPSLNPGAFETPGSLADTVTLVLNDTFTGLNQLWQRGLLGVGDNVERERQIGAGEAVSTGWLGTNTDLPIIGRGSKEATPAEQLVAAKLAKGEWTQEQAADFLVASGNAAHDPGLNVALAVADPTVAASFGAGALAKLGTKGIQLMNAVEKGGAIVTEAEATLKAAQETAAIAQAARKGSIARQGLRAANKAVKVAEKELTSAQEAHAALTASKVARTTLAFGEKYKGLEGTMLGRTAKAARVIIDPLHAIDLHMPGNARMVDLFSDSSTKTLAKVTGTHYNANMQHFLGLDATGFHMNQYARDLATASMNRAREGLLSMHQASAVLKGTAKDLAGDGREQVITNASKVVRDRDLQKWLREDYTAHVVQQDWSAADHLDIAQAAAKRYPVKDVDAWLADVQKMSKEQKSLLKFAVYGGDNSKLLQAVSDSAGHAMLAKWDPSKFILIAKTTLTKQGADGLLLLLKEAKTNKKRLAIIREYQARYPELLYIPIDTANPGKSIDAFIDHLANTREHLPQQFVDDEIAQMSDGFKNLSDELAGGYSLGMRPKDEFLWGVERSNARGGEYIGKRVPWADHVGEGGVGFRTTHELPLNIMGKPIIGAPARKVMKAVDYMAAGARTAGAQVSGAQVHEVARQRFVSQAVRGKFAEYGLTENVAGQWFDRLQEYTKEHTGYSGPRGFGKGDLYNALDKERLIPQTLLNGSMQLQPADVLHMVLEAYDGDMRYIGLTQKLSGRAKKWLSAMTGYNSNFAGQIAEHAWPTLKFAYNPLFQLQEKIEPVVLNAQRGVSFAVRPNMSKADASVERLLQRMTDNSIIRQADLDTFEQSQYALFNRKVGSLAKSPSTRLGKMQGAASALMDVQGTKRIAMLRAFRKGLGKELKGVWEETQPGVWDDMLAEARARAGRFIDEDEFAVNMMAENLLGNDISITRRLAKAGRVGGMDADWANAIKTGEWSRPTHLGEVRALDIDHIAGAMNVIGEDGKKMTSLADLRKYIAADKSRLNEVGEFLNRMGADKDYIHRVENSLTFSWEGFWREAADRYSLTTAESKALQDMIGEAANLRDMNPVDFLSQVYQPGILDGTEGIIGSLDKPLGVIRRNKEGVIKGRGRSALAGEKGVSTREDLVRQLSGVFSAHLDPSAKRALLMQFKPELMKAYRNGEFRMNLNAINDMWDADAETQLADRILQYMDGVPGTGAYDTVTDTERGLASVRAGVDSYLRKNGVEPLPERRNYSIKQEEEFYQRSADEFGGLPEVDYERTGRRPTSKQVYGADGDLKPQPAGVDDRTYQAYQQFVHETRAQWDHLTGAKSEGGMGIKVIVAKGDPYTADAAGRAAMAKDLKKGTLRVKGTDSDHPLMTNEQNVMFRAVHDVFGHAAEGFEFGPRGELNAAAAHFRMYGPEARGPLLTETHGQTSWVNYSNDIYDPMGAGGVPGIRELPPELDPADPIGSFEQMHHFEVPEGQAAERMSFESAMADPDMPMSEKRLLKQQYKDAPKDPSKGYVQVQNMTGSDRGVMHYDKFVGDGIRGLPVAQQHIILQQLSDLLTEFPDMRIHHVDVVNLGGESLIMDPKVPGKVLQYGLGKGIKGVAYGSDEDEAVLLMNADHFGIEFDEEQAALWRDNEETRNYRVFTKPKIDPKTGQQEVIGGVRQWNVVPRETHMGVSWNYDASVEALVRHEAGHALDLSLRPRRVSGMHMRIDEHGEYFDTVKRLENDAAARKWLSEYGMTDSKEFAAELFSAATDPELDLADLPEKLRPMVQDYQDALRNGGYWKPRYVPDPEVLANQGKTIREVNAAKRGTVYAPQKAGLLPQSTIDEFATKFVGQGKHVESNPDVARVAQQFGKWSQAAVFNGLLKGEKSIHGQLLQDIGGIPTHAAVPYNYTEGITHQLAVDAMKRKWQDAFRLQYFAQDRSMLERSINHPMFGMYPASYMWGKLMPEVVQFIAQRPFGIRTGGALTAAMHAQSTIALRREFDPEFDAQMEKMGHSQALGFAGYLLPTLPWDVSASAPIWMKDVAAQGTRNQQLVDAGKPAEGFNAVQPLVDVAKKLDPIVQNAAWAGRAIDELNGPNTLQEQRQALVEKNAATKGANMEPALAAIMAELHETLAR